VVSALFPQTMGQWRCAERGP